MKYKEDSEHILKGFTFSINFAEKIGYVGSTGSCKSSIIQALFRLIEIDKQVVPDSRIASMEMHPGVRHSVVRFQIARKSFFEQFGK